MYNLLVQQFCTDGALQFQLILRLTNTAQTVYLGSALDYAGCKTLAAAIFKTVWVWDDALMTTGFMPLV